MEGPTFILRIEEQETRLTLHEHDDDDDDELSAELSSLLRTCGSRILPRKHFLRCDIVQ